MENPEADLQATIREGRAVLVAGTGISIAASYDSVKKQSHPQASWAGLLEDGLKWLKEHNLMVAAVADAHLTLLQDNPQTHRFISVAEDITVRMGSAQSVHFKDWLARTIGTIKAHDRSVIDALDAIRQQGHLLATTNYDGLLLGDPAQLTPITWQDKDALIGAVRKWDTDKVIFLHGYWRQPTSVILDWKSYEQISRDEQYREDLTAFWKTNTWVYVGCGVNGLADPDFGLLLERYAERARQAGHWDYCLVRSDQKDEFQSYFNRNKLNLRAISFGNSHGDLPQYLRSLLPPPVATPSPTIVVAPAAAPNHTSIPSPPALYAEPDYIGSHQFVGRETQLKTLSDWAMPTNDNSLLLFEAIGGNGKSMLTWEWTTKHATTVRPDWAGRFWYSFYERGAIMQDFCQRALAYMTGEPLEELKKKKTADLKEPLLALLHERPWLIILDGLERVLVAYHRIDAAEVPDEEVNIPTDKVLNRNPCDAIRDEDNDLLRALAACAPSKILVSSRLIPRVLLNQAGLPIPGVHPAVLPGLDEADAEKLLRSCGITGSSSAIRYYLTTNCANHPLVIGVLAGLINDYLPDRGNFDAWSAAPDGGAALDLGSLDLVQRRNHILRAALDALPPMSRQLLSTLALLSESVDYETLKAFDPNVPPDQRKLGATVKDLERRGLLQYDGREKRHDLHPVVRGVAAGGMNAEDKERYGQRVVDHFSSQAHSPYHQAQTMEDLSSGLHVVRTLLKLGHFQHAADALQGDLARALCFNLEAHVDTLSLLRPFFPAGWDELPKEVTTADASYLANEAAGALFYSRELQEAFVAFGAALRGYMTIPEWSSANVLVRNIGGNLTYQNLPAKAIRMDGLALDLATVRDDDEDLFMSRLFLFADQSRLGQWQAAEATWRLLDPMGRGWSRAVYRQGNAEWGFARWQFWQGTLQEEHLMAAATLAEKDNNRTTVRNLHWLRGVWRLEQHDWSQAAASFQEAVRMARERRLVDEDSETGLALAKFNLHQLDDPPREAERLAQLRDPAYRTLAMLWLAIGDHAQAKHHALAAYRWAWADGEPYVNRYQLTRTTELLQQMNVPVPTLPPYDKTQDKPFPWEADVRAAIEKLRKEKKAEQREPE